MEKPTGSRLESMAHASKHATPQAPFEASMGVYIFKRDVLVSLLHENEGHFGSDAGPDTHFGHDVMPHALREGYTVVAHHFDGYWRVGPVFVHNAPPSAGLLLTPSQGIFSNNRLKKSHSELAYIWLHVGTCLLFLPQGNTSMAFVSFRLFTTLR